MLRLPRIALTFAAAAALATPAAAAANTVPGARWHSRPPEAGASAGAQASAATTVYAGNTAPEFGPMVLQVAKTRVSRLNVHYNNSCFAYTSSLGPAALKHATVGRDGKYSATAVTSLISSPRIYWSGERYPDQVVETIRGTLSGGTARGTLRATVKFLDGSTCTTGKLRFLLVHKPGRIFGGVTSEGMPVSEELSTTGSRIKHLHIAYTVPCPDGSSWVIPDFLTDFPLADGTMSTAFTLSYPDGDGGTINFAYQVASRVGATKASGSLQVTISRLDPTGTATATCASRPITWNARS
jgi:hypothetical protein